MATRTRLSCPSWCTETGENHYLHAATVGRSEGVLVRLNQTPVSHGVRIWVGTVKGGTLLRLRDGGAELLEHLGHKELAALVRKAVETAQSGSGRCAS
jgi:hypothetical protein